MDHDELDDATRQTLERLKSLRKANEGLPEPELRQQLSAALQEMLAPLASDDAIRTVETLRSALVREARDRQERIDSLEREVVGLRLERDGLLANLAQRATIEASSAAPGKDRGVERIRRGLLQVVEDGGVARGTMSLSAEDLSLLMVVQVLYRFALEVTTASEKFVAGAPDQVGETMIKDLGRSIRETFQACAESKPGSLKILEEQLARSRRFLPALNRAYLASIRGGVKGILEQLDPQEIAEKHRRRALGISYEDAWKTLSQRHAEITGQTPGEVWEQYFRDTFQSELARRTEGDA